MDPTGDGQGGSGPAGSNGTRIGLRGASVYVLLALALAACGVFYVLPYSVHLHLPAGNDSYFYVGAIRDVARVGLVDPVVAARPAYPLMGAALSSVSGSSPWVATVGIPIALALALGLAGAALAARWALRGPAVVAFAVLATTSGVAARLVAGKSENLMVLALVCAMLAVTVWARGSRRWVSIGLMGLVAGLLEWPLAGAFVGILGAHLVLRLIRRDRTALAALGPVAAGAVGGLAGAMAMVLIGGHARLAIEHLPVAVRYGPRFRDEMALLWPPLTLVLVGLGWWAARRFRRSETEGVRRFLGLWLLLTGAAVVVGLFDVALPTYRSLGIALPVALATAAAAFAPVALVRSGRRVAVRALAVAASVVIGILAVVPAASMWYSRLAVPISPAQVNEVQTAARYALSLPEGRRAVLVMRLNPVHYLAFERIVADVLPVGEGGRLLVFLGGTSAAKEAREPVALKPENQAIIHALFPPVAAALRAGAPILTGSQLDHYDFAATLSAGARPVGPGDVAVVRGPPPPASLPGSDLPVPLLPPRQIGVAAAFAFAALLVAGLGWSFLTLPGAPAMVRTALAPAFGAVVLPLVAYVAERAGATPHGLAAAAELAVAVVASAAAGLADLLLARRRTRLELRPVAERAVLEEPAGADS
ncbi:MAG: hypothetical protein ACJ77A_17705 [Actinomycetota bacterium]